MYILLSGDIANRSLCLAVFALDLGRTVVWALRRGVEGADTSG